MLGLHFHDCDFLEALQKCTGMWSTGINVFVLFNVNGLGPTNVDVNG